MRKLKTSKGFTLMEMLIVVAIIAILVAIAVPSFTDALNKARVAADEANIRSGYTGVVATVMAEESEKQVRYFVLQKDGSVEETDAKTNTETTNTYACLGNGEKTEIAGCAVPAWSTGDPIVYTYTTSSNTVTIEVAP